MNITNAIAKLPIKDFIEWAVTISLITALFLLGGCATEGKIENPTNQMDARSAQALALAKIGESAKDGETQRLAILAVALLGSSQPQSQPPQSPRTVGESVVTFLDRTTERLLGVVPAWFAYRSSVKQSDTSVALGSQNRDIQMNASNNFLGLGVAGIQGTAIAGVAGANALQAVASRPQTPTTSLTLTGNQGAVNIGSGTQTNSSNNPQNPAPVVCVQTGTTIGCSR